MENKVAIHQPNYLPWPGYFYKLWLCDTFIFLDHVKLNKQGLTRRTYIPKLSAPQEKSFLTVPLIKHPDHTIINALTIDHTKDWATKHYHHIYEQYHSSELANDLWPKLEEWFHNAKEYELLADWNVFLIKQLMGYIGIERNTICSTSLNITGVKDDMHTEIIAKVAGTAYISGKSGTAYRLDSSFNTAGIHIIDTDFLSYLNSNPYKETNFQAGLNILDILFQMGKEGLISYFENYSKVKS